MAKIHPKLSKVKNHSSRKGDSHLEGVSSEKKTSSESH